MDELKEIIFGMESNKAAGPNRFNIEFYQHFQDAVKFDLFALLEDLYENVLDLYKINFGIITLILKGSDADKIQKYRPICLLDVIFKIITKILVNRLIYVIKGAIQNIESTFLKGRYILERVLVLHETLNIVHKEKTQGSF